MTTRLKHWIKHQLADIARETFPHGLTITMTIPEIRIRVELDQDQP